MSQIKKKDVLVLPWKELQRDCEDIFINERYFSILNDILFL